jgi:hypothetical protein
MRAAPRGQTSIDLSIACAIIRTFFSIDEIALLFRQLCSLLLAIAMDSYTICRLPS